ncbi:MAG: NAD(P)-binding protein [Candidatus Acetothermia bacterium]|nr:NAD(P)-binding protein [Candidatus Acetothermia bacterium]MDH7505911.1 NAD(P)-binding protein [Candidatus Acetothermia bacterium]
MSTKAKAKELAPDRVVAFASEREMPPLAVSLGTSLANKTGSWRYLRPVYEEKEPPCNHACPAGNDIRGFIALILKGKLAEARELLCETNPFPAITGRVCHHPCELECNRQKLDEPLSIRALERLAGDEGYNGKGLRPPRRRHKERIAIVGSGPAGLSCAYFLARKGYQVAIFEAERKPGGMLRWGIPEYRLPKAVLERELALLRDLGIEFKAGLRVGQDLRLEELQAGYDTIFLAVGATAGVELELPGGEAAGVLHGLEFLKRVNFGERVELGERVAVIGGGNTAMDAARVALRLGAKPVVVYRRTRAEMPAIPEEVEAALEEGVEFTFLAAPIEVLTANGQLKGARFIKMELGPPDETGRRRPMPIKGSEFKLELDNLILAVGERPDLSFLPEGVKLREGRVNDPVLVEALRAPIFAGGDAATGAGTVVEAIASGRRGAEAIDRHLRGLPEPEPEREPVLVPFERINLDYFEPRPRAQGRALAVPERVTNFEEIELGLSLEQGQLEAERCFSCGGCNQCDNCITYCPDVAISRHDDQYEVDYDYCKGCGICAQECPRWVISLVEEEK